MKAIQVWNATKEYENNVIALDKVNYSFEYGKTYTVTGESGAGKTTLLGAIASFIPLSSGEIFIDGEPISNCDSKEIAMLRRHTIGYVFQSYLLNPRLTALENVMLPMLSEKKRYRECENTAAGLLEKVGLSGKENEFPYHLSGGEQQRVSIARALANNPRIILADEPTGNLDEENENKIFRIMKGFSDDGKCVIMVSHSKEAKNYADEILNLKHGVLVGG